MRKIFRKINIKNFVNRKKNRIFANDEPTALATDVGKRIPTLEGEDAIRFLENMKKAEALAEIMKYKEPTLDELKNELTYQRFFLESEERNLEERKRKIMRLEKRISDLEKNVNGKN